LLIAVLQTRLEFSVSGSLLECMNAAICAWYEGLEFAFLLVIILIKF